MRLFPNLTKVHRWFCWLATAFFGNRAPYQFVCLTLPVTLCYQTVNAQWQPANQTQCKQHTHIGNISSVLVYISHGLNLMRYIVQGRQQDCFSLSLRLNSNCLVQQGGKGTVVRGVPQYFFSQTWCKSEFNSVFWQGDKDEKENAYGTVSRLSVQFRNK